MSLYGYINIVGIESAVTPLVTLDSLKALIARMPKFPPRKVYKVNTRTWHYLRNLSQYTATLPDPFCTFMGVEVIHDPNQVEDVKESDPQEES